MYMGQPYLLITYVCIFSCFIDLPMVALHYAFSQLKGFANPLTFFVSVWLIFYIYCLMNFSCAFILFFLGEYKSCKEIRLLKNTQVDGEYTLKISNRKIKVNKLKEHFV